MQSLMRFEVWGSGSKNNPKQVFSRIPSRLAVISHLRPIMKIGVSMVPLGSTIKELMIIPKETTVRGWGWRL